jgi:hypothetical protein
MKAFLRRKPLDDYTPDYTVCQLDFDLAAASKIASGRQPLLTAHNMIRASCRFGCTKRQYAQILPPGGEKVEQVWGHEPN